MCEQHQASLWLLPVRETPVRAQQVLLQRPETFHCCSDWTFLTDPLFHRTNPIGMRGHMAKCYGDLVMELWSGTQKSVAPLKLRVRCSHAPFFLWSLSLKHPDAGKHLLLLLLLCRIKVCDVFLYSGQLQNMPRALMASSSRTPRSCSPSCWMASMKTWTESTRNPMWSWRTAMADLTGRWLLRSEVSVSNGIYLWFIQ